MIPVASMRIYVSVFDLDGLNELSEINPLSESPAGGLLQCQWSYFGQQGVSASCELLIHAT